MDSVQSSKLILSRLLKNTGRQWMEGWRHAWHHAYGAGPHWAIYGLRRPFSPQVFWVASPARGGVTCIIICFPHVERTSPGCIGMEILHSGACPSFFYMKLLFLHLELFAVISCSTHSRMRLPYTDYLGTLDISTGHK